MEELSIEEKAKRYGEALERAKGVIEQNPLMEYLKKGIEYILPELKESEDEKIRKWLINEIKINHHNLDEDSVDFVDKAIAWLEKQGEKKPAMNIIETWKDMRLEVYQQASGNRHEPNSSDDTTKMFSLNDIDEIVEKMSEQKPADKVGPKFKVGDWINGYYTNYKVLSVNNEGYVVEDVDGNKINILFENERFHHLYTIEDAKDGDVLATEDWVFIFKKINSKREPTCYCHYDIELGFFIDTKSYIATGSEIYPATKEQRDTLIKAMADARYTFDFEKNELKKVEPTDKYKGLTDFERTLADICIGWIGEELGWKQYIKDNADVLLKIAAKKFNSVQDVPF